MLYPKIGLNLQPLTVILEAFAVMKKKHRSLRNAGRRGYLVERGLGRLYEIGNASGGCGSSPPCATEGRIFTQTFACQLCVLSANDSKS